VQKEIAVNLVRSDLLFGDFSAFSLGELRTKELSGCMQISTTNSRMRQVLLIHSSPYSEKN
jgi:hypothetical protein